MKKTVILFLILSCPLAGAWAQGKGEINEQVKRILFLGNSITYSGQYVAYIEAYLKVRYPGNHLFFINGGLPSETVSGLSEDGHAGGRFPRPDLHERLGRVLEQTKPDLVFACYGMNDGIYLPFDDERFEKFSEGIIWLHGEVVRSGAGIIHLTPPVYDERKGEAYSNVLDIYSDWLISCRYKSGWKVIDIHWPMKKYLDDRRMSDSSYFFARDGVHPDETGHWLMAKQVLLWLGEKEVTRFADPLSSVSPFQNGEKILRLIRQREDLMKDALLTSTGHKRPEMRTGLPMPEALKQAEDIEKQINALLNKN